MPDDLKELLQGTAPASEVAPAAPAGAPIDKIIIAIHGIGSQRRSDTIRSVARRFGDRNEPPLPVMPLGFFSIGKAGEVHLSRLDAPDGSALQKIGFAEVFWADIPRQVVKEEDTLEETKAWGATVVSRAQAAYSRKVSGDRQLKGEDFKLAGGVVDEIVETIAVLENLLAVFEKMGLFKFDLAPLLRDYIGDVQIVTEFSYYRQKIVARFHSAMAQIVARFFKEYPNGTPEIYIVAHSEGTVVSFLGLLEALSGRGVADPDAPDEPDTTDTAAPPAPLTPPAPPDWIRFVRGFMTIGSPIDKHLVLWPKLWDKLDLASRREGPAVVFGPSAGAQRLRLEQPIQWRNYYDYGDPIGFKLESAVEFLKEQHCQAFEFDTNRHDFGFSRYWLPGKAHNDYWGDPEVFGHFIDDVVMRAPAPAALTLPAPAPRPPESRRLVGIVATSIPYLLTLVLHFCAVYLLFNAVTGFLTPDSARGVAHPWESNLEVALLGLLMTGVTVAARVPRLVKTAGWRWHGAALIAFLAGAVPAWFWLPQDLAEFLFQPLLASAAAWVPQAKAGVALLLLAAAAVAASGWLAPRRPRVARRTLIFCGALLVLAMLLRHLFAADVQHPAWPLVLAGLAFLYLWWLGILLFDLAFVWHRYIRNSVAVRTLSAWNRGHDARPDKILRRKPKQAEGKTASAREPSQPDGPG